MGSLVRTGQPEDADLADLLLRVSELETLLRERSAELSLLKSDLAAFEGRYRHEVGRLHEQLDELERAIAEAELGIMSDRLTAAGVDQKGSSAADRVDVPPRLTSDAVRKLFRDVAKAIHPDLAHDDPARDCRHALMIEANRAYALGDEERLRWILQAWESSPEAVQGSSAEATRMRLERRMTQIEAQLEAYAADLAAVKSTPLWKLKAMVDAHAARGTDLVRDMVNRLKRDILTARNRLEAIQPRS